MAFYTLPGQRGQDVLVAREHVMAMVDETPMEGCAQTEPTTLIYLAGNVTLRVRGTAAQTARRMRVAVENG